MSVSAALSTQKKIRDKSAFLSARHLQQILLRKLSDNLQEEKKSRAHAHTKNFNADYAEKSTDGRGFTLTGREAMRFAIATIGDEVISGFSGNKFAGGNHD